MPAASGFSQNAQIGYPVFHENSSQIVQPLTFESREWLHDGLQAHPDSGFAAHENPESRPGVVWTSELAEDELEPLPPLPSIGTSYFSEPVVENAATSSFELPSVQPLFAVPAQRSSCLTDPYLGRSEQLRTSSRSKPLCADSGLPSNFVPWWSEQVAASLGIKHRSLDVDLNSLIENALYHSPHIQVAATATHIQRTAITEEMAQFDWQAFLESKYTDTNDPIGNTLTTGNNDDRFVQQEWFARGGARRRNGYGGETELTQRLGYLDNNSRFLLPPNQGSSRLELNYRHPILRGKGVEVNESLIVLADIDFQASSDTFMEELQNHLLQVTETYWELVRARAELLQKQKVLISAQSILENLEARLEVDTLDRQVFRARAAVANRRAEIVRSLTAVENAESRLRLLVNEPRLLSTIEFTPVDLPVSNELPIELSDAVSTAIANRQDISRAIRDVTAANVRNGVAINELLPKLDFLIGTFVAGLDGDSDFFNSWVNQFRDGRPGFNVGIDFEVPIGNRAAQARQQRRKWELTRSLHQFRAVTESGITEVEIAVREVHTAHQEMVGRFHAMAAAENETQYLLDRWRTLPEIDDSATLLLENLLDSQERLADEEAAFARSQYDFAVAVVRVKQSMGILFQVSQ